MPKEVTVWETEDGRQFANEYAARDYEAKCKLAELISVFAGITERESTEVASFVHEHLQQIAEFFGYTLVHTPLTPTPYGLGDIG